MSAQGVAQARELMARKLRNAARASSARRQSGEPDRPASEPTAAAPKSDRSHVLRDLASSLKDAAGHTGGLDPVNRHVANARRFERDGDLAEAAASLRVAVSLSPGRLDLKAEHARVNAALAASLATAYEEQAQYEQRHNKWGAAALSWGRVAEGRPDDPRVARLAAEAFIQAKGDLHKAKRFAERAVDLDPDDVANLRTLARVFIAAGLGLNARRVLQRAAALDPGDEMVENLLRGLD
jgi:tetratricopeptide (TPR) repeat protein